MPRKAILTKETIVSAALKIARKNGLEAVTARALSAALGCSLSPLFTVFDSMEEIKQEVKKDARAKFIKYVKDSLDYPNPFMEYGLRVIRFAKQDPVLFNLAFLQPGMGVNHMDMVIRKIIDSFKDKYSLTEGQSLQLFFKMWVFDCGLALISSSGVEQIDEEKASILLSDQFVSTLNSIKSGH